MKRGQSPHRTIDSFCLRAKHADVELLTEGGPGGAASSPGGISMTDYAADVKKYDAGASDETIGKIVKHLGIALRSRDSSMVACSDPSELARVSEKWCGKKLGVTGAAADDAVAKVCEMMKGDNSKARVTFYYLVARELGKLGDL
jgi:hypothetical protein